MSVLLVNPAAAPTPGVFATISAAVSAANNGDTINVVPGTYHEGVDVTKSVSIIGGDIINGRGGSTILLANPSSTGFAFDANNITVENFTISQEADGIRTNAAFSGFHVLNDSFVDDEFGVHLNTSLNSSALTTTISSNSFTFTSGGVVAHDDVLIDNGGARNVVISNNFFHASEIDASVSIAAKNQSSNVQIVDNRFASTASIIVANTDKAKVDDNVIQTTAADGIFVAGAVTNSEIANNNISDNISPAPVGIVLTESLVQTPNTGDAITGNTVLRLGVGIVLSDSSHDTVSGIDIVNPQGDGIEVASNSSS